jgi:glutathione peroxidase
MKLRQTNRVVKTGYVLLGFMILGAYIQTAVADCPADFDQDLRLLRSDKSQNLCDLIDGKPALIINTASFCGYTGQFKGLEALHKRYVSVGLQVIGFPSNDFKQEAGNEEATAKICYVNYGVSFTMFAPVSVAGSNTNSVFTYLAKDHGEPTWNFNKYLVDRDGNVVKHYSSGVSPDSATLRADIESVL